MREENPQFDSFCMRNAFVGNLRLSGTAKAAVKFDIHRPFGASACITAMGKRADLWGRVANQHEYDTKRRGMPEMLEGRLLYASQIAEGTASVWFVFWALRRKYELDEKLSLRAQTLRLIVVAIACGLTMLSGFGAVRVIAWISGTAFLAWPNLAHHAMNMTDRFHSKNSSSAL